METEKTNQEYYFRLNLYHRILHFMVIVSFIGLVITGIPLKYSYTSWAIFLSRFLGGFQTAGFLHRVFAIVTFIYFGMHIGFVAYLYFKKKKKDIFWGPDSMIPQPKDFIELYKHFRWFIGKGEKPQFDRWTYWEKFDYWAVFWGVAIIGFSGLLMWLPTFFSLVFPGWIFNIAQIIHSDEALLAAGFIFSIHFFNTHLRPEKFPLDPVIFTGRISKEVLINERPLEYNRLLNSERLETLKTDPPPLWMQNLAKIIGFSAVSIGLILIFLIIITEIA